MCRDSTNVPQNSKGLIALLILLYQVILSKATKIERLTFWKSPFLLDKEFLLGTSEGFNIQLVLIY
jgi:hypothetical protein